MQKYIDLNAIFYLQISTKYLYISNMDKQKIHIGELVRKYIISKNLSFAFVAKEMGISRQALDAALKKEDMSVKRLLTLSEVLKYDFFQYFTEKELHQKPAGSDEMEYTLHIKVPKNKIREVMDYIDRKDLFEILEK